MAAMVGRSSQHPEPSVGRLSTFGTSMDGSSQGAGVRVATTKSPEILPGRLPSRFPRSSSSGEVNAPVADTPEVMAPVGEEYAGEKGVHCVDWGGLTVSGPGWWLNVRPSSREPLLRLNGSRDLARDVTVRDEVSSLIRGASL
jgi:phosphomannomutase